MKSKKEAIVVRRVPRRVLAADGKVYVVTRFTESDKPWGRNVVGDWLGELMEIPTPLREIVQ